MKKIITFIVSILCLSGIAYSQGLVHTILNAETCGDTVDIPAVGLAIDDDGAGPNGEYSAGVDYWITIMNSCYAPSRLSLRFDQFDIHPTDTLYIYDGPDTNATIILRANNRQNILNTRYFTSRYNTSNALTLRYKTNNDQFIGAGFVVAAECAEPCEFITPVIEQTFYKIKDGIVTDTGVFVDVPIIDSTTGLVSDYYKSANLCAGEGIIVLGYGIYTHTTGYYNPSDATSTFSWEESAGRSLEGNNETVFSVDEFPNRTCYDIILNITDEAGCTSLVNAAVTVRVASNPIRSITDNLASICNNDSLLLKTVISSDSIVEADLQLDPQPSDIVSKTYDCRTFIPDGPRCGTGSANCYSAPVEFSEFPAGKTIQSAADICSVCVTYEHTYMGDYDLKLKCPTQGTAVLKYYSSPSGYPSGTSGGGGTFTGYPYGGASFLSYDHMNNGSDCDTVANMFGVGLEYCFSRNADYTLVTGLPANTTTTVTNAPPHYLASNGYEVSVTYDFDPIPSPYVNAGSTCGTQTFSTKLPSNHEEKINYYMPADDFSQLIGCPMNGTWEIEICDHLSRDNGWVFSWSLDICGVSNNHNCEYIVGIDSIRWAPSPDAVGMVCNNVNDSVAYISTPGTAGEFPLDVHVYDEFGCVWDTNTFIKTAWVPEPNLGPDTAVCDPLSVMLDATDPHDGDFSYSWLPFGETTVQINTTPNLSTDTNYIVTVTNSRYGLACKASDTVLVQSKPMPIPGFTTNIMPAAGCSPFEVQFLDTSTYGYSFLWRFGDGFTSQARRPIHTYSPGLFDVTQVVTTDFGCVDSITKPQYIWSFYTPDAQFTWEPQYPTVLNPTVQLTNQTEPMVPNNIYEWSIYYDQDGGYYYSMDQDVNYTWNNPKAGTYLVKLLAHTDNYDQNGTLIVCQDSVEVPIMVVQDFLQFPSVITANGDGINDRFVIKSLVDGLAYPNNSLSIYNRWGILVYSRNNISLDEEYWDPAAERAPAGTYFYYFNAHGYTGSAQRTGVVEVLR